MRTSPAGGTGWSACTAAQGVAVQARQLKRIHGERAVLQDISLQIAPGDTVRFIPTQSGHNAATLPGLLPEGAQPFKGKINQEVEQTFSVPGLYGIQCTPHLAMGMVMLIQVGEPSAEPPVLPATLPKRALDRLTAALQQQQVAK